MLDTWIEAAENPARKLEPGSFAGNSCDSSIVTTSTIMTFVPRFVEGGMDSVRQSLYKSRLVDRIASKADT